MSLTQASDTIAPANSFQLDIDPQPEWAPTLAVSTASLADLEASNTAWLSTSDATASKRFDFDKRRHDFLLGRHAAYGAIQTVFPSLSFVKYRIDRGVFDQPIWATKETAPLNLSIAHSHRVGAALVSPAGFPMALDIERVNADRISTMAAQMTEAEIASASGAVQQGDAVALTLLWCAKEALSKALGCGLTCPMTIMEIKELELNGECWNGTFLNFFQYRFYSWFLSPDMLIAIVLHRHYEFTPPGRLS